MADILSKISTEYDVFTSSQKKVANYVTENYSQIAFDTLEDLADKIQVSTTTIIRFARSLGYNGYSEMQKDIQGHIKGKISLPERLPDAQANVEADQLLRESFENDIANITETLEGISTGQLQEAVDLMVQARRVYILGLRGAFAMAHYAASHIGQIRRDVHLIQSAGMLYPEDLIGAGPGDVCFSFLFPRYSKNTANIISWLKKKQVKIILVTSKSYSAIHGYGDIIFPCSVKGSSFKNSYAAPLCLVNYFTSAMVMRNYDQAREALQETEEFLKQGYYLGL